jgi:uncharacterized DUF497 family protein
LKIEFDSAKSAKNAITRGLPFELVVMLDWGAAHTVVDDRRDYGETRFITYASLAGRLHVVCYVKRGDGRRIISFRKANDREIAKYAKAID